MTLEDPAESFEAMVGRSLRAAVADMSEHIDDPTEWELEAPSLLPLDCSALPVEVLDRALGVIADSPGGRHALRGLAAGGDTAIAERAHFALAELEPGWSVPGLSVASALTLDNDEPVSGIHLLCRREGSPGQQLFSFLLEHDESAGALKGGLAVPAAHGKRALAGMRKQVQVVGLELVKADPEQALAEVVEAARRGALRGFRPDEDGMTALAIVLRASGVPDAEELLRALEEGEPFEGADDELGFDDEEEGPLEREIARICDIAFGWFCAKEYDDEALDRVIEVVGLYAEYRMDALGGNLDECKRDELDGFMLRWMPKEARLPQERVDDFPANLAATLEFLAGTFTFDPRAARTLGKRALANAKPFAKLMESHGAITRGPAATMAAQMQAAGVDLTNPNEVALWIEEFNARPYEERDRVLGPALAPLRPSPEPRRPREAS
ncbi:MAG: hypothetical protein ACKVUT_15065 [Gaiella sp.]